MKNVFILVDSGLSTGSAQLVHPFSVCLGSEVPTEDDDEGEGVQEGVRLDEEAPEPRSVMGFIGQSILLLVREAL